MATVNGDFYDYDGVMFCHGRIENMGAYTCDYVVMTVGGGYEYRARIKDTVHFPGVFNINTADHAIGNSPTKLSSGVYTVYLEFYQDPDTLIIGTYLFDGSDRLNYRMHNTLTAPQLTYNPNNKTITVGNVGTGRYFLELRRKNRNIVNTSYSETEKDYFYTTLMRGSEGGKYNEGIPHTYLNDQIPKARYQWRQYIPTIILFDTEANFSTAEKNNYYNMTCDTLDELEEATGKTFTKRDMDTRTGNKDYGECVDSDYNVYYSNNVNSYSMIIRFGKESTMHLNGTDQQGNPIPGGQGKWGNYLNLDAYYGVTTSHPAIAVDASQANETVLHVIHEEIMQSLGMGNDSHSQETSLHWDPHWSNPESYTGIDARILELVCSEDICDWSSFKFLNDWDTPCILYKDYTGQDIVFDVSDLNDYETYEAWAWVAQEGVNGGIIGGSGGGQSAHYSGGTTAVADGWDDDPYSNRNKIEFYKRPAYPYPGPFAWTYPKTKGGSFNLTASEWNGLQTHIKKVLLHKLGHTGQYNPVNVSSGEIFYASKYNEAGSAIKQIQGYGTFIPTVLPGDEITADTTSLDQRKNAINKIVEELNAIPQEN